MGINKEASYWRSALLCFFFLSESSTFFLFFHSFINEVRSRESINGLRWRRRWRQRRFSSLRRRVRSHAVLQIYRRSLFHSQSLLHSHFSSKNTVQNPSLICADLILFKSVCSQFFLFYFLFLICRRNFRVISIDLLHI